MSGFRRRLINNCSSNNSIACEYIESDGTLYINTGFAYTKLKCDVLRGR